MATGYIVSVRVRVRVRCIIVVDEVEYMIGLGLGEANRYLLGVARGAFKRQLGPFRCIRRRPALRGCNTAVRGGARVVLRLGVGLGLGPGMSGHDIAVRVRLE